MALLACLLVSTIVRDSVGLVHSIIDSNPITPETGDHVIDSSVCTIGHLANLAITHVLCVVTARKQGSIYMTLSAVQSFAMYFIPRIDDTLS